MKNILLFIIVFCSLGLLSCSKKSDPVTCSIAWSTELQDEVNAISNAATDYANDQSIANCNAYKAAFQAYINALKPYRNCAALTGQNRFEFEAALSNAEESLDTLC